MAELRRMDDQIIKAQTPLTPELQQKLDRAREMLSRRS